MNTTKLTREIADLKRKNEKLSYLHENLKIWSRRQKQRILELEVKKEPVFNVVLFTPR